VHKTPQTLRSFKECISIEYVRRVLAQVENCERELGDAQASVCLNCDTHPPHYRVDAVMDVETGETAPWSSFSGRTHRPLSPKQQLTAVWSSEHMTLQEIADLIGEMRGYSKRS